MHVTCIRCEWLLLHQMGEFEQCVNVCVLNATGARVSVPAIASFTTTTCLALIVQENTVATARLVARIHSTLLDLRTSLF